MSKSKRTLIVYPKIAASFGGASQVEYSKLYAYVTLPGEPGVVKIPRWQLPESPADWSAFSLSSAVARIAPKARHYVKGSK